MVVKPLAKVPDHIYVRLYAGMGDFYKRYFLQQTWTCLEDLKAKNPHVSIKALVASQTLSALNLVDHHPCIDEVVKPLLHPRQIKKRGADTFMGGYIPLSNGVADQFEQKMPPIYLSETDKKFVNSITTKHKEYIVIHPFSGDRLGNDTRTPLQPIRYLPIIKSIIDLGHPVVLLGSSWARKDERGTKIRKEDFGWNIPGLINLIDKTNVRTGAELVKRSSGFIGTASCFMCAAWSIGNIRSVIIISSRWKEPLETMIWAKDRCKEPQNKIIYIPKVRMAQTFLKMKNDTADWFK